MKFNDGVIQTFYKASCVSDVYVNLILLDELTFYNYRYIDIGKQGKVYFGVSLVIQEDMKFIKLLSLKVMLF